MKKIWIFFITTGYLMIISSNNVNIVYKKGDIEVYAVDESSEFKTAQLNSFDVSESNQPNNVNLNFTISNYELKASSNNNLTGICANSKDGQHIHLIVDNKPYTAIYKTEYLLKEDSGSHLALSFLSRSHHQSIKNKDAFKLKQIDIGKKTKTYNLSQPYLFYSRPKGIYVDNDTKEILLDFYLVNTSISPKGNKVKVEIDGEHKFTLTKWSPYLIKGLTMGEHKVKISLVNRHNQPINAPFLPVERSFSLQSNPK